MNLVIEKGRLTKAPEMSYTANGKCVATFTIAVAKIVRKDAPADTPRAQRSSSATTLTRGVKSLLRAVWK